MNLDQNCSSSSLLSQSIKYMTVTNCYSFAFHNFEKILWFNIFDLQSIGDAEQARELLSKARLNKIICYPSKYNWFPQKQDIHWNSNINKNLNKSILALVETTWNMKSNPYISAIQPWKETDCCKICKKTQARQISRQKLKVTIQRKQSRETYGEQLSWVSQVKVVAS